MQLSLLRDPFLLAVYVASVLVLIDAGLWYVTAGFLTLQFFTIVRMICGGEPTTVRRQGKRRAWGAMRKTKTRRTRTVNKRTSVCVMDRRRGKGHSLRKKCTIFLLLWLALTPAVPALFNTQWQGRGCQMKDYGRSCSWPKSWRKSMRRGQHSKASARRAYRRRMRLAKRRARRRRYRYAAAWKEMKKRRVSQLDGLSYEMRLTMLRIVLEEKWDELKCTVYVTGPKLYPHSVNGFFIQSLTRIPSGQG